MCADDCCQSLSEQLSCSDSNHTQNFYVKSASLSRRLFPVASMTRASMQLLRTDLRHADLYKMSVRPCET